MLLAEIAATLWFLAFGALVDLADGRRRSRIWVVGVAVLVGSCLVLSTIVITRIFIRGLL